MYDLHKWHLNNQLESDKWNTQMFGEAHIGVHKPTNETTSQAIYRLKEKGKPGYHNRAGRWFDLIALSKWECRTYIEWTSRLCTNRGLLPINLHKVNTRFIWEIVRRSLCKRLSQRSGCDLRGSGCNLRNMIVIGRWRQQSASNVYHTLLCANTIYLVLLRGGWWSCKFSLCK